MAEGVTDPAFAARMEVALVEASALEGRRVTQREVGARVAKLTGESIAERTVSRYFNGRVPDVATVAALAKVMGVDPGWLGFGPLSKAPEPPSAMLRRYQPMPQPD